MSVVMAGGGTTGHISPMLATAEALRLIDDTVGISCVGTPVGLETRVVPQAGWELDLVDPVPLPRSLSLDLATLPFRIRVAVRQAKAVLRRRQARVVVGFGGYASLPVFLAARELHIPVVVHEANAVPGLANRIAARFAAVVCVTFANTGLPRQIVTGMPVRRAVSTLDRTAARSAARASLGLDNQARVLLVSGGSQGAKRLNDAVVDGLERLDRAGVTVVHVTGSKNFATTVQLPAVSPGAYLRLPYVDRMEQGYAAADLMVARSGAATVTETALVGLPTVFVPLPHGNGEQAKNAQGVVAAGGARLINDAELTGSRLVDEVTGMIFDQALLDRMSSAAKAVMPADAATVVARHALAAARGEGLR
ncbi:MAG: undecaprenyldiphospho-muramoylpentapeptide beta-N-acetylglucosaminyltransferase [Propionibacteriaceae bacterium]|jgi:UDP-N-acetylglucosamine--N-acetylmuramyl-(pentapeptide) pyrophosphoryl-undecaprenol N-acetylglucosamine transferase|nr:undecaprenyldiphospho-muramoylpentapeptide beta-N-acetylglucosaminyltransferase [Propionibacteriaceae bacterium]